MADAQLVRCKFSPPSSGIFTGTDPRLSRTLSSQYYPSAAFGIVAMVIFGASGVLHLYQLWRSRRWTFVSVICAAGLEVYGWYLRFQSASDVMYG